MTVAEPGPIPVRPASRTTARLRTCPSHAVGAHSSPRQWASLALLGSVVSSPFTHPVCQVFDQRRRPEGRGDWDREHRFERLPAATWPHQLLSTATTPRITEIRVLKETSS